GRPLPSHPADVRGALLEDATEASLAVGGADGRGEPHPGAETARGSEALDLADVGDHEQTVEATPCRLPQRQLGEVATAASAKRDRRAGFGCPGGRAGRGRGS